MKPLKNLANLKSDHLEDLTPGARTVIKKQGKSRLRNLDKESIKESLDMEAENKDLDKIETWINFAFRTNDETESKDDEFITYQDQVESEDFYDFGFEAEDEEDMEDFYGTCYDPVHDKGPEDFAFRKDRDLCSLFPAYFN